MAVMQFFLGLWRRLLQKPACLLQVWQRLNETLKQLKGFAVSAVNPSSPMKWKLIWTKLLKEILSQGNGNWFERSCSKNHPVIYRASEYCNQSWASDSYKCFKENVFFSSNSWWTVFNVCICLNFLRKRYIRKLDYIYSSHNRMWKHIKFCTLMQKVWKSTRYVEKKMYTHIHVYICIYRYVRGKQIKILNWGNLIFIVKNCAA